MFKRRFLSFLLACSILSASITPQQTNTGPLSKAAALLSSSIVLSYYKDTVASKELVEKVARMTNTDPNDLVDVTVLGLYHLAWSCVYQSLIGKAPIINIPPHKIAFNKKSWDRINEYMTSHSNYLAVIEPLLQMASTSNFWNALFKKLPLLDTLACEDPYCKGICDLCEYKHLLKKIPVNTIPWGLDKMYPDPYFSVTSPLTELIHNSIWAALRRNDIFIYRWYMLIKRLNPLNARHTVCTNDSCTSICNQCKLKKLYA